MVFHHVIVFLWSRTQIEVKPYVLSTRGPQRREKGSDMRSKIQKVNDELRPEYDFDYSKAVRGKYYRRLIEEGSNIIVLEPDVAKVFKDSAGVNEALRSLLDFTRATQRLNIAPSDAKKRAAELIS